MLNTPVPVVVDWVTVTVATLVLVEVGLDVMLDTPVVVVIG